MRRGACCLRHSYRPSLTTQRIIHLNFVEAAVMGCRDIQSCSTSPTILNFRQSIGQTMPLRRDKAARARHLNMICVQYARKHFYTCAIITKGKRRRVQTCSVVDSGSELVTRTRQRPRTRLRAAHEMLHRLRRMACTAFCAHFKGLPINSVSRCRR